ncbi:MAG: hypothetical protein UY48_C0002G0023 [Candidatus Gottesmanbacteria bacterium GW2011_GWB1_49_7]|uniref:Uncharacterized protein n=1 Tax=Candidatus Gottesmanbacteria bacterium GW2011_GWB1_49_7 TaxID=1618448 RepID=A0A0G1YEE2_9BACT|nr:MAG: hypothetical protein UY48_C0002G0023 [Candidatus Gottesmanbacteria bacterium GW2011_GWB1_49_7]
MKSTCTSKTGGRRIGEAEREAKAVELRRQGKNYDQIAATVGFADRSGAFRAVKRALERLRKQTTEEAVVLLRLENDRLDVLQAAIWEQAVEQGDLFAVDRLLRLMQRRAALNGLDQPTKTQVTGANGDPLTVALTAPDLLEELRGLKELYGQLTGEK